MRTDTALSNQDAGRDVIVDLASRMILLLLLVMILLVLVVRQRLLFLWIMGMWCILRVLAGLMG